MRTCRRRAWRTRNANPDTGIELFAVGIGFDANLAPTTIANVATISF